MTQDPTFKRKYIERWLGLGTNGHIIWSIDQINYWYAKIKRHEVQEQSKKRKLSTDGKHD